MSATENYLRKSGPSDTQPPPAGFFCSGIYYPDPDIDLDQGCTRVHSTLKLKRLGGNPHISADLYEMVTRGLNRNVIKG